MTLWSPRRSAQHSCEAGSQEHLPCNDVTTNNVEFVRFEVPKDTHDRMVSVPPTEYGLPAKSGNAMRVEVRHGDWGWNKEYVDSQGNKGKLIEGGWRAEAQWRTEQESGEIIRYQWSTMLHPDYPLNPKVNDPTREDHGEEIWQVIFQWHQGGTDRGVSPPVEFVISGDRIWLSLNKALPEDCPAGEQFGRWPVCGLARGSWHDFEAEIRWHRTEGTIKLKHNGCPVLFDGDEQLTGLSTLFEPQKYLVHFVDGKCVQQTDEQGNPIPNDKPASVYLKAGLYREPVTTSPEGPFVLYHDEFDRCVLQPARRLPGLPSLVAGPRRGFPPAPPGEMLERVRRRVRGERS